MLLSTALYDTWQRSDGTALYTYTILTMDAHKSIFHWVSQSLKPVVSGVAMFILQCGLSARTDGQPAPTYCQFHHKSYLTAGQPIYPWGTIGYSNTIL